MKASGGSENRKQVAMNASRITSLTFVVAISTAPAAPAASVDMADAFRAVGRENDVRVDAQLLSEVVRAGSPIAVTYQVQNLTAQAVAVAEKLCSASYDADSQTIVVSLGSEIPPDGNMPKMVTVAPGETKTFAVATNLRVALPMATARRVALPRFVQMKISILRNLEPFTALLTRQREAKSAVTLPLTDAQFDEWLKGNETIFLNSLPIRYETGPSTNFDAAAGRRPAGWM